MRLGHWLVFSLFLSIFSCNTSNQENTGKRFSFVSSQDSGISFVNEIEDTEELNILNYLYFYNGAGVSIADYNNDSYADIYFTSNKKADKLFLNQGNFEFQDVTSSSGINNASGWTTGVTSVDINQDGLMDLYVCKVGNHNIIQGHNLLYVNLGIDENGVPKFKESSKDYGLDIESFATQSTFFDFDLDGDLDLFLLNHSVHPNSNYGLGNKRKIKDSSSGDRLYKNVDGKFLDVSEEAGIFQGKIGYGLGVTVSDLNNDNYPDIYVGNDFFENDYLYINQQDGSFKEIIHSNNEVVGHTTHFSMGNDIADLDNDGHLDIVSLDMLPEDLVTYKTSGLEYNFQIYQNYLRNGYAPQYMQNTLHFNNGNGTSFSETAFLSGISATEWSWSPLIADFDNDGLKDIFISNGILGATNDMDFISFIANDKMQKQISEGKDNLKFIKELPKKKTPNYFFKNKGNRTFEDVTSLWSQKVLSYSNGSAYADLDNDGDLDIVVNNINEPAFILKNKTDNNFIKIQFKGTDKNLNGIGAKVLLYSDSLFIKQENFNTRGYLSSSEPNMTIGLGKQTQIDSLKVIWPDHKYQILFDIPANQEIELKQELATGKDQKTKSHAKSLLENTENLFNYQHTDQNTTEFNIEPLIPFASTNLGPDISVSDINNDGLIDVFIGGSKQQASKLFVQSNSNEFISVQEALFEKDKIHEDVSQLFFDANNDGFKDLIVVSGGNEFKKGKPLQPRLYLNHKGEFKRDTIQFNGFEINASKVASVDIENDGDLDLLITSNLVPRQFGVTPTQYLFKNDGKGNFSEISDRYAKELRNIGNVQDAIWIDLNNDNLKELIVVGHWMPISIFNNTGKNLELNKNNNLQFTNGWWNAVKATDFDKDGDIDLIAGNWGLNSRLNATKNQPIKLYRNDFDDNGSEEPVLTYFYQDQETPFASKEELAKQMPFLNKKYLSFQDFATTEFEDLFSKKKLNNSLKKETYELASCYLENLGDNTFKVHELPFMTQISSVFDIALDDFNNDGFTDALFVGNNYEISTQLSRLDASHGVLLLNDQNGWFYEAKEHYFDIPGTSRNIEKIDINNSEYYIVTRNNNKPVFLKKTKLNEPD